jgi:hypothetical protein
VFSAIAIGPKDTGFKLGRVNGFLRAIKFCITSSCGGKVKPLAPCYKILRHVKITSEYEQRYFKGQINRFLRQVAPDLLLGDSAGRIARELWWTNQFSPVNIIPPWFCMLIYHLWNEQWARW